MDNWMKINEVFANSLFSLSQEMLRFMQDRFREDVETNVALAGCRSPSDSFECQRRFLEKATAQYREIADKLTGLMTRMTSEAFSATQ